MELLFVIAVEPIFDIWVVFFQLFVEVQLYWFEN